MSGRRRNSGTLPGSRRLTFESRTFPKFWPDTESFESRGERSRKDSVYRDYTNFAGAGEPGRFICLAQCPRTSGGRSQRSGEWKISMPLHRCRALLCCRIELLAPPLECLVVDASLSDEKEKMYCGPWNCGASYVSFHRSISLFLLFCGECGDAIQQQKRFKGDFPRFHKSTTTKRQRFQSFSLMSFSTNSLVKVKYLPLQF